MGFTSRVNDILSKIFNHVETLPENAKVIVVIGPSGSGKSQFINTAARLGGSERLKVGLGLETCTEKVQHVVSSRPYSEGCIVFVDTPPFPDVTNTDKKVTSLIDSWQAKASQKKTNIAGVLYLYKIDERRMNEPPGTHYNALLRQNGSLFSGVPVFLVTTMWDKLQAEVGEEREAELVQNWKELAEGSNTLRYDNTEASACEIIQKLLGRGE